MRRYTGAGRAFVSPGDLQQQTVLVATADQRNADRQAAGQAGRYGEAWISGDGGGGGYLRPPAIAAVTPNLVYPLRRPVARREQHLDALLREQQGETLGIGAPLQRRQRLLIGRIGQRPARLRLFENLLPEDYELCVRMFSVESDEVGEGLAFDLRRIERREI